MKNSTPPMSGSTAHATQRHEGLPHGEPGGNCTCFIIPEHVLERFAKDKKLTAEERQYFADAAKLEQAWRKARVSTAKLATLSQSILPTGMSALAAAGPPSVLVFDCQQGTTLPGSPVANPGASTDGSAKRAFNETTAVVDFYQSIFGRNSLDNAGMTLLSSIHFSVKYNNAGWTGSQMKY